jgi:hypothetical protein
MRLIAIIYLFSTVIPSLGMAKDYSGCDQKLKEKMIELVKSDEHGILAKQFKLTTLKLTKKTLNKKFTTLEAMIKKNSAQLNELNTEDPLILKSLVDLYGENISDDMTAAIAHIEEIKKSSKEASYWNKNKRFMNKDVSAYLLFDKLTNNESEFSKTDIAITWYMNKVSEEKASAEGRFSAKHNLTNLSNQLTRYTGVIRGTDKASEEDINKSIETVEQDINKFLDDATLKIQEDLKECLDENKLWKGACDIDRGFVSKQLEDFLLNMEDLSSELNEQVSKGVLNQTRKNLAGYQVSSTVTKEQNEEELDAITGEELDAITGEEKDKEPILELDTPVISLEINNFNDMNNAKNYILQRRNGYTPEDIKTYFPKLAEYEEAYGLEAIEEIVENDKSFYRNNNVESEVNKDVSEMIEYDNSNKRVSVKCNSRKTLNFEILNRGQWSAGFNVLINEFLGSPYGETAFEVTTPSGFVCKLNTETDVKNYLLNFCNIPGRPRKRHLCK